MDFGEYFREIEPIQQNLKTRKSWSQIWLLQYRYFEETEGRKSFNTEALQRKNVVKNIKSNSIEDLAVL
jgi:hypothetical protein